MKRIYVLKSIPLLSRQREKQQSASLHPAAAATSHVSIGIQREDEERVTSCADYATISYSEIGILLRDAKKT